MHDSVYHFIIFLAAKYALNHGRTYDRQTIKLTKIIRLVSSETLSISRSEINSQIMSCGFQGNLYARVCGFKYLLVLNYVAKQQQYTFRFHFLSSVYVPQSIFRMDIVLNVINIYIIRR